MKSEQGQKGEDSNHDPDGITASKAERGTINGL